MEVILWPQTETEVKRVSGFNGVQKVVVIFIFKECYGLLSQLTLADIAIIKCQNPPLGHYVKEKMKTIAEALDVDAPFISFTTVNAFSEMWLSKSN